MTRDVTQRRGWAGRAFYVQEANMHVDPLEPVSTRWDLDEVTEINLGPADASAWTPTETLNRELVPVSPESWWLVWATVTGGLAGAAVVLAALVTALAMTA